MAEDLEILDCELSDSVLWDMEHKDVTITALLGIPDGHAATMKIEIANGSDASRILLNDASPSADTIRKFVVQHKEFTSKNNTLTITFADPIGSTKKFMHEVTIEDRDTFKIHRALDFSEEYRITGNLKMNPFQNLMLKASGFEEGIAMPKKAIEMDGRAKIHKIVIDADDDTSSDESILQKASYRQDRSDSILQKIPLRNIKNFESVNRMQMTDGRGV